MPTKISRSKTPVALGTKNANPELFPVDCKWNERLTDNKYKNFANQSDAGAPSNIAAQRRTKEYSSNIFNQSEVNGFCFPSELILRKYRKKT